MDATRHLRGRGIVHGPEGKTQTVPAQIAEALYLSINTVRSHVRSVLRKIDVHSSLEAVGIGLRAVFDRVAESKRSEFVEQRLLANNLPGARLKDLRMENKDDLGAPLVLKMKAEVPQLARNIGGGKLLLKQLFAVDIAQIASLPQRQTPLLLGSKS